MKKVLFTQRSDYPHWVGDGFPVRTVFSYNDIAKEVSPFLLLDYAGPADFPPTQRRLGVGSHPHRGFETVTVVYEGQVEHRDSAGGGGVIDAGGVQWMTAGSGLVHEERHGKDFAQKGGRFEMVQLWVNLPKKDKMTTPRYQGISNEQIPVVNLKKSGDFLRVIAGRYGGSVGPAQTFSPINMWDIRLSAGQEVQLTVPAQHTATAFVLNGKVQIGDSKEILSAEMAILDRESDKLVLRANADSKILFLSGEPLPDPVVGYGPFVMTNQSEILQAMQDFENGKMGTFDPIK